MTVVAHSPRFVFIGAQSGLQAGPGSSVADQAEACLEQIVEVLDSLGYDLDRVVKVQVFLADMAAKDDAYNPVYNEFFHSRGILRKPARSTVGATLTPGELVRMEAIAYA